MTDSLDNLVQLVANQKSDNESNYSYKNTEIQDFVNSCWSLIPTADQANLNPAQHKKLAFDINRALHSYPNDLSAALKNFRKLNLSTYSSAALPYGYKAGDTEFISALENSHDLFKKGVTAGNVQLQLATHASEHTEENKRSELFRITANLLVGIATTKGLSHSRSEDTSIINKHGQIDPVLVLAVAEYVNDNFAKLENLDEKKLKLIGESLKKSYKKLDLKNTDKINEAFNKIDLSAFAAAIPEDITSTLKDNPRNSVRSKSLTR